MASDLELKKRMAVSNITNTDFQDRQARFAEWGGLIQKALIVLAVVLVVAMAVLIFKSSNEEAQVEANRKAWDKVFAAVQDKKTPQETAKAYEGALSEVKGSSAYPFVLMQVARDYYEESTRPEKPQAERLEKVRKSNELYTQLLSEFGDHALYGAIAAESVALTNEQLGKLDEAIAVLEKASSKYEKNFLAPKINYEYARLLWLRCLKGGEKAKEDRTKAERAISQAAPKSKDEFTQVDYSMVSDFRDFQNIPYMRTQWQRDALLLKALLDKPGPGLPDGNAPAERPETAKSNAPAPTPIQLPGNGPTQGGFVAPQNPTDVLNKANKPNAPAFQVPAPAIPAPAPANK